MPSDLRRLSKTLPGLPDRVLLELGNSVVVAADHTRSRRRQGAVARLVSTLVGRDRERQLLTLQSLVDGQAALAAWATDIQTRAAMTDFALEVVADRVIRTQQRIAAQGERIDHTTAELRRLADIVARVAEAADTRFHRIEDRLEALEQWRGRTDLRMLAGTAFELAVGRWATGQTYANLPWLLQVVLLARELATGPPGQYADVSGDQSYQELFVLRVIDAKRTAADGPGDFVVTRELDRVVGRLGPDEPALLAELLGAGLEPMLRLPTRPLTATITTALELSALPGASRPPHPAETARALVSLHTEPAAQTADASSFTQQAIAEQATAVAHARRELVRQNRAAA